MGVVDDEQIAKARARAHFDVRALAASVRGRTPEQIAAPLAKQARYDFLAATLPDATQLQDTFERILFGNELQPISYLARGDIAARAVARLAIRSARLTGWGTGFLISPGVLLTNNHVFPDAAAARQSRAEFSYEVDLADREIGPVSYALDPDALFSTSVDLDYTVVAVRPMSSEPAGRPLADFGWLPLLDVQGKAFEGEWLTIVQHPNGERKQVCVRENRLLKRADQVLWYSADTLAGSSGSPVFNNDWFVVALHHSGVPEYRNGVIQTIDGRDYDPATMDESRVKWAANEGIRASRIAGDLRGRLPDHPLLQPLYRATPQSARITGPTPSPLKTAAAVRPSPPETDLMADHGPSRFPIDVRLRVEADGVARILEAGAAETGRSDPPVDDRRPSPPRPARFDAPFDADYAGRRGFDPGFLGDAVPVARPALSPGLEAVAARHGDVDDAPYELDYQNYTVVMNKERRLAIYSAANVDFANRYDLSRPRDVWRRDPRIKAEHQLENGFYERNQFDRGHLTRREDMEFGPTAKDALLSANDTLHWTNCTPQHARFNQSRDTWQGIERYILETTILGGGEIRAQVMTGPVFEEDDPDYRGVQYPLQYWKLVAALDEEGALWATAYVASQAAAIDRYGVEAAPFGAFKTFQTTVAEVERLTDLTFEGGEGFLRDRDPLKGRRLRPRRGFSGSEASYAGAPDGYRLLEDLDDIELGR